MFAQSFRSWFAVGTSARIAFFAFLTIVSAGFELHALKVLSDVEIAALLAIGLAACSCLGLTGRLVAQQDPLVTAPPRLDTPFVSASPQSPAWNGVGPGHDTDRGLFSVPVPGPAPSPASRYRPGRRATVRSPARRARRRRYGRSVRCPGPSHPVRRAPWPGFSPPYDHNRRRL